MPLSLLYQFRKITENTLSTENNYPSYREVIFSYVFLMLLCIVLALDKTVL